MSTAETGWVRPTLTLVCAWAVVTVGLIIALTVSKLALPVFLSRAAPFILAGFITGSVSPILSRRTKAIAAAVLAVVSAAGWTTFSVMTHDGNMSRALPLFAASLPVLAVASLWAYFGMYLGGRKHEDRIEQDLRDEIASDEA